MSDQTPHQLTEDELKALTIKIKRHWDSETAQKIILHHRRMAFVCAKVVSHKHRKTRYADIRAASMLGLVRGVRYASSLYLRLHDSNITEYLAQCCYTAIRDFIEMDRVIRVPHTSLARLHAEGEFSDSDWEGVPCTLEVDLPDSVIDEDRTKNMTIHPEAEIKALNDELIKRICDTDQQSCVLHMRMEGHTYQEIADHLDCTEGYISQLISKIRKNYLYQTEQAA